MPTLTTPVPIPEKSHRGQLRLLRVATIVAATVIAGVAWLVQTAVLDIALRVPSFTGPDPMPVGLPAVIATSLILGLAGWGLLAVLEHTFPRRGRRAWTIVAVAVTVLSILAGPMSAASTSAGLALTVLHLLVFGCVIIGFRWSGALSAQRG